MPGHSEIALEGSETGIDGTETESGEDEPIASAIVLFGGKYSASDSSSEVTARFLLFLVSMLLG